MLMLSQCQTYFDVMSEWPRDCHDPWENRKNIPIWGGEREETENFKTLLQFRMFNNLLFSLRSKNYKAMINDKQV